MYIDYRLYYIKYNIGTIKKSSFSVNPEINPWHTYRDGKSVNF